MNFALQSSTRSRSPGVHELSAQRTTAKAGQPGVPPRWLPAPRHSPADAYAMSFSFLSGRTFTEVLAGLACTSIVSPGRNGFSTFFRALCAGFFMTLIFIRPGIVQAPTAPFWTWRAGRARLSSCSAVDVRPRAPGRLGWPIVGVRRGPPAPRPALPPTRQSLTAPAPSGRRTIVGLEWNPLDALGRALSASNDGPITAPGKTQ